MQTDQRPAVSWDRPFPAEKPDDARGPDDARDEAQDDRKRPVLRIRPFAGIIGSIGLLVIAGGYLTALADDSSSKKPVVKGKKETEKSKSSVTASLELKNEDAKDSKKDDATESKPKIIKTEAEWRKILKPEQFRVTRLKETEVPFNNKFWNNKRHGKYLCVCCGEELYRSDEKFESGTGWPSFWAPVSEKAIGTEIDVAAGTPRTEVHCERCGAHLGHVFDAGRHQPECDIASIPLR